MGLSSNSKGIEKALKQMAKQHVAVERKALKKAAERVAETLERNTPRDPEDSNKEHLQDHVVVGTARDGQINVGYDQEVAWRVHFTELGTIKQRPQGFVERTDSEMSGEVIDIIEKEIRRGLGL